VEKRTGSEWIDLVHELGKEFEKRSATHDREESFVSDNYEDLKRHRFFAAAIPEELGGGGAPHPVMCDILRTMAGYCGSTSSGQWPATVARPRSPTRCISTWSPRPSGNTGRVREGPRC